MNMCVYVCVFVFLLCGAVSCRVSRVVVGWVVGCGVVLSSLCRGPSHCVVIEKLKKKEQERNGAKVAEQIVCSCFV